MEQTHRLEWKKRMGLRHWGVWSHWQRRQLRCEDISAGYTDQRCDDVQLLRGIGLKFYQQIGRNMPKISVHGPKFDKTEAFLALERLFPDDVNQTRQSSHSWWVSIPIFGRYPDTKQVVTLGHKESVQRKTLYPFGEAGHWGVGFISAEWNQVLGTEGWVCWGDLQA